MRVGDRWHPARLLQAAASSDPDGTGTTIGLAGLGEPPLELYQSAPTSSPDASAFYAEIVQHLSEIRRLAERLRDTGPDELADALLDGLLYQVDLLYAHLEDLLGDPSVAPDEGTIARAREFFRRITTRAITLAGKGVVMASGGEVAREMIDHLDAAAELLERIASR